MKRWKVSDVFAAMARDKSLAKDRRKDARTAARYAREDAARPLTSSGDRLSDVNLGWWLRHWAVCGDAFGKPLVDWDRLTHEQRCDLLVAEARRLNVRRRA